MPNTRRHPAGLGPDRPLRPGTGGWSCFISRRLQQPTSDSVRCSEPGDCWTQTEPGLRCVTSTKLSSAHHREDDDEVSARTLRWNRYKHPSTGSQTGSDRTSTVGLPPECNWGSDPEDRLIFHNHAERKQWRLWLTSWWHHRHFYRLGNNRRVCPEACWESQSALWASWNRFRLILAGKHEQQVSRLRCKDTAHLETTRLDDWTSFKHRPRKNVVSINKQTLRRRITSFFVMS